MLAREIAKQLLLAAAAALATYATSRFGSCQRREVIEDEDEDGEDD
jgi:hypothetical protein